MECFVCHLAASPPPLPCVTRVSLVLLQQQLHFFGDNNSDQNMEVSFCRAGRVSCRYQVLWFRLYWLTDCGSHPDTNH